MWVNGRYKVKVNLIRHGKTLSNDKHLYISKTDEELLKSEERKLLKRSYPPCDLLFTSGLKRCDKTAEIIYKKNDIIKVPLLCELDFGDFEGKSYDDLKDNPVYREWIDAKGMTSPPNGEDRLAFVNRVIKGFNEVLARAKEEKEISLVVHGGTIMALVSSYTDLDYYDVQLKCGDYISCDVMFEELNAVFFISHFSIVDRSGS